MLLNPLIASPPPSLCAHLCSGWSPKAVLKLQSPSCKHPDLFFLFLQPACSKRSDGASSPQAVLSWDHPERPRGPLRDSGLLRWSDVRPGPRLPPGAGEPDKDTESDFLMLPPERISREQTHRLLSNRDGNSEYIFFQKWQLHIAGGHCGNESMDLISLSVG